jgi:uncharacterized protein YecA (UPF0149 family)
VKFVIGRNRKMKHKILLIEPEYDELLMRALAHAHIHRITPNLYAHPAETVIPIVNTNEHLFTTYKVKQLIKDKKIVGRNEPCSCGSGRKYKKCCL